MHKKGFDNERAEFCREFSILGIGYRVAVDRVV